ncbi:hypothetical protein K2173_022029 [Erythroxylum novogranatense]|uniref:Uncharacterized protein n=1 Tax=Erythroxylum novogranatense TaxID=1862640 RepID=A0AAV8T2K8_9ROSI|nr:hypothetical protein K2173_022029 [Erythroxylum novogranatense]
MLELTMSGAIPLSLHSALIFPQPTELRRSLPFHVQSLSLTHQLFHSHSQFYPYKCLSTVICGYSKLDGEDPDGIGEVFFDGNDIIEDESDEDEETESSIDLLVRFLHSMFKKLSKRAKKACRSLLPSALSPQLVYFILSLVYFAVDGFLLLAGLSLVKAVLEVACTLGSTVFAVILLLRVVWAAISYSQSSGNSYGTTQPVG